MTTYVQEALLGGVEGYKVTLKGKSREGKERSLVGRVLHLGGGVQSSTLVEMMVEGELPKVDVVVFADTGDEPKYVYQQVEYLNDRLHTIGLFVVKVAGGQKGIVKDLVSGTGRFASIPLFTKDKKGNIGRLRRQCTNEYKIKPVVNYILNFLCCRGHAKTNETKRGPRRRVKNDVYVESWIGFSYDEWYRLGRGDYPSWQRPTYPLFDMQMTRQDCIDWLIKKDLPIPRKSACRICPYRTHEEWRDMLINNPRDFGYVEEFDDWLRSKRAAQRVTKGLNGVAYIHQSCKPLTEAVNEPCKQMGFEMCGGDSCWT